MKIGHPKREQSYSNHPFSGAFAVYRRVTNQDFMVHVTWGAFVLNVVFATVGRHFLKPVKPFVAERRKSAATKRCSWEGASPLSPWSIWVFPKIAVPQNGWFVMEHPIKMDDLGVPLFLETPISLENWSGYGECLTFYYLGWSFK